MIILEAGLDLKLTSSKKVVIRDSFLAAIVILAVSIAGITAGLYYWLHEPVLKCLIYATPLSIMSSSIVIPSLHAVTKEKKEFLTYEASFSDILGILIFNFLVAGETFSFLSLGSLALNTVSYTHLDVYKRQGKCNNRTMINVANAINTVLIRYK